LGFIPHRINQLPVVANGRLVAVITDRDLRDAWTLIPKATSQTRQERTRVDSDKIPVEAVMTREVLTVSSRDSLETAAELMRTKRIGALPVVAQARLEGIITRSDILDAFLGRKRSRPGKRTTPPMKTS
jgi:acetoin utilization protein AcuB